MEEDIKNIEEMLEVKEDIIKYHSWVGTNLINSVENLLKAYKELEEENNNKSKKIREYEKTLENLQKNTIWKSKVKEKIEELENLKLCSDKFYQLITEDKIKLLQKLLEEE